MKHVVDFICTIPFIITGVMGYAYVLDLEPLPLDKEYLVERDYYNRTNDFGSHDFPSFAEWVEMRQDRRDRFHEWVDNVLDNFGKDVAEAFDPWYQDTREGHAGAAPENWARGERD